MPSNEQLSIGEAAKRTGVKVVTIRYYEKIGLLPGPPRSRGNYRVYDREQVRRLRFIRRCRDLGFPLQQVRDLLQVSADKTTACAEVDLITKQHLTDVEQRIADLARLATELRRMIRHCQSKGVIADCQIIEALSPE